MGWLHWFFIGYYFFFASVFMGCGAVTMDCEFIRAARRELQERKDKLSNRKWLTP